jgi:hypothetical protein
MPFDLTAWRAEVRELIGDFARDPQGALSRAGVHSLYGFLIGSTILPIAAAYAHEPASAISALIGITGSLGANLLANLAQRKYDAANAISIAATEAQSAELALAYETLAQAVEVIPLAEAALAQARQADVLEELRAELRRLGKAGDKVAGDKVAGDKVMGDKVAGDKYVTVGPHFYGPISGDRDLNIGTHQTITNYDYDAPQATTPTRPHRAGPALGLRLEDPTGAPLASLIVGQAARLRLAVDGDRAALPVLDLQLEADGAGVDWAEGTRRPLKLRPGAKPRLPQWALVPEQAGPLMLRVLVLSGGALVQQLALSVTCQDATSGALLSAPSIAPAAPAHSVPMGFALSSAPALPAHANSLTLAIEQEHAGYRLLLLDGGGVALTCTLALTDHGLADLLAYARSELLAIVYTQVANAPIYLQPKLAIPQVAAEQTLARLARLGAYLWSGLFAGPGSGRDAEALGERLRAHSQAGALHLTVAAAHLPFPWPLLYDRDPGQAVVADGFWGFRHVLSTLPTSGRIGPQIFDQTLGAADALRALAGLNLAIDRHRAVAPQPLIAGQRQMLADLGIAAQELNTEAALRDALAAGTEAQLLYLFCHMNSALPEQHAVKTGTPPGVGSTRIVLTEPAQALTLRDLLLAAPLSKAPLLRGGPLVVLNACGSAELSPLTYDGLAPYLLDQGARAVVGTECETPIFFGAAFGQALLAALVRDRLPVGEALRAARRQFLEHYRNPLGLLYALYGSADLRVELISEKLP